MTDVGKIVDRVAVSKRRLVRLMEFFVVGLLMGISEDLMAIYFSTGAVITIHVVVIASLVSLPFAFFSELIVDHPGFWPRVLRRAKVRSG